MENAKLHDLVDLVLEANETHGIDIDIEIYAKIKSFQIFHYDDEQGVLLNIELPISEASEAIDKLELYLEKL